VRHHRRRHQGRHQRANTSRRNPNSLQPRSHLARFERVPKGPRRQCEPSEFSLKHQYVLVTTRLGETCWQHQVRSGAHRHRRRLLETGVRQPAMVTPLRGRRILAHLQLPTIDQWPAPWLTSIKLVRRGPSQSCAHSQAIQGNRARKLVNRRRAPPLWVSRRASARILAVLTKPRPTAHARAARARKQGHIKIVGLLRPPGRWPCTAPHCEGFSSHISSTFVQRTYARSMRSGTKQRRVRVVGRVASEMRSTSWEARGTRTNNGRSRGGASQSLVHYVSYGRGMPPRRFHCMVPSRFDRYSTSTMVKRPT